MSECVGKSVAKCQKILTKVRDVLSDIIIRFHYDCFVFFLICKIVKKNVERDSNSKKMLEIRWLK